MSLRKELTIAVVMLVFGIVVLPALVFVVGITIVGPYEGENGLGSLYGAILGDAARLGPAALILIFGPYIGVQCLRLLFVRRRQAAPVTAVTKPQPRQRA